MEPPEFRPGEYLTFRVGGGDFAIDASRVRGIVPWNQPVGFPVIDLRGKLGIPAGRVGRRPCIVVLEAETPFSRAGFLVDCVSDIVTARRRDYRLGKLRMGGRPRRVLDADAILSGAGFSLQRRL